MRDLGTRIEPFVDPWLIDRLRGARLQLQAPQKREIVLEMNAPGECSTSGYFNLFHDGERIRLYYRGAMKPGGDTDDNQTACYAESDDGIHFVRPALGLVEYRGSTANNIIHHGIEAHNFCAFRDDNPACPPEQRYKAVGGGWKALFGLVSSDGIHWRRIREEKLDLAGAFDSLNVPCWDPHAGCYRMFLRDFNDAWGRIILSATSQDFLHWTTPIPYEYEVNAEPEQYYTNATHPCPGAEHILLAFPKRFLEHRTKNPAGMIYPGDGLSDAVFMSSRDGVHWYRFREAWVRPGLDPRNWTHRGNMPARGIIPTAPTEWSMYISEHYGWDSNRLRRLVIRPFGFAAVHADYDGGELMTHPFVFGGARLYLNYATSVAGSLRAELQDVDGKRLTGFTLRDMAPLFGDELDAPIAWKGSGDLSALRGRPVRLRVQLKDADLFALRTGDG